QIWLDEEDGRPVQSYDAPGTGGHRDPVFRVTVCSDCRERQWWKRSASQQRSLSSQKSDTTAWIKRGSLWRKVSRLHPVCFSGLRASAVALLDLPGLS